MDVSFELYVQNLLYKQKSIYKSKEASPRSAYQIAASVRRNLLRLELAPSQQKKEVLHLQHLLANTKPVF